MGSPEFFAVEAGEYLDQLRVLAARAEPTAIDEFAGLCRSLRGSSLMANQQSIGRVATALEQLALAAQRGRLSWDHHTRGLASQTVEDIAGLVARIGQWSASETAMIEAIVAELEAVTGRSSAVAEPDGDREGHDVGFVAFVASQAAALAGALDETARTMDVHGSPARPLTDARKLVSSLTGLAALSDVPPIAELLDGIDRAIEVDGESTVVPPSAAPVLRAGATALSKATAELLDKGAADPDSAEAQAFAHVLRGFLEAESEIVPIESLLYDDEPAAAHTSAAISLDGFDDLELISLGERLQLAADELVYARSEPQRDLRIQTLSQLLNGLSNVTRGPLQIALSDLREAALDAISRGVARERTDTFVSLLRDVGGALSSEADTRERASHLVEIASELRATPADREPAAHPDAHDSTGMSSRFDSPADDVVPGLAASWSSFERLRASAAEDTHEPKREAPIPHVPQPVAAGEQPEAEDSPLQGDRDDHVLPIADLCYRGQDAVDRAMNLREEIMSSLADPAGDRSRLAELVEEVFDLVQLGLDDKT